MSSAEYFPFCFYLNVTQCVLLLQRFLRYMGATTFDPFNICLLNQLEDAEVVVFINEEDRDKIQNIPNLLELKRCHWVQFVLYKNVYEIKNRTYSSIMRKGGIVVPDDMVLLTMDADTLKAMLEFMEGKTRVGTPWLMILHQHILNTMKDSTEPKVKDTMSVIVAHEESGQVEIIGEPQFDDAARPSHDYLPTLVSLQTKNCETHRHVMLLSGKILPHSSLPQLIGCWRCWIYIRNPEYVALVWCQTAVTLVH